MNGNGEPQMVMKSGLSIEVEPNGTFTIKGSPDVMQNPVLYYGILGVARTFMDRQQMGGTEHRQGAILVVPPGMVPPPPVDS